MVTIADLIDKYGASIFIKATDENRTGTINNAKMQLAINDAKITLSCFIDITDTEKYGAERIKKWWRDLAYYDILKTNEKERISQDKYDSVIEEIKSFKENIESNTTLVHSTPLFSERHK